MSVKEEGRRVKNRDKRGKDKYLYKKGCFDCFDRLASKAIPYFLVF